MAKRADLIADLKRVAEEYPSATRDAYRQHGHYPEHAVAHHFGSHTEFKRAAGLLDTRETLKMRSHRSRREQEQRINEYATQHLVPHRARKYGRGKGTVAAVVLSDLHSQYLDPFAFEVALGVCDLLQPELIILNGDVCDFPRVGRFSTMPTMPSLQQEIDFTREKIIRPLRERNPSAQITWHIGNHEYRLVRYLADVAPALSGLRCLKFDALFGVKDFGVELVFGNSFLAEPKKKSYAIYYDCWVVTHGIATGKTPAQKEIARFGLSGTSGHTHRPQLILAPTPACPTASWMSTGMMCSEAAGQHYVDGPSGWTMGFGAAMIDTRTKTVIQSPVIVHPHFAAYQGAEWKPTKKALRSRAAQWD